MSGPRSARLHTGICHCPTISSGVNTKLLRTRRNTHLKACDKVSILFENEGNVRAAGAEALGDYIQRKMAEW